MHVITKRQLRGAEIFASQLSAAFVSRGHEVIIVALQPPVVFPAIVGVTYIDMKVEKSNRFMSYQGWKTFAALVKEHRPDIIQANASETLKFTVLSKLLFRWKVPIAYRNANKVSDFIKSAASKYFNTFLVRRVDFVISVSENCRVDFVKTFGLRDAQTITIPIGTILSDTKHNRPSIPSKGEYWINVASLVPEKNHIGLLRIFKAYVEQGGRRELIVVGDGKLKASLLNDVASLGLQGSVHFLGYRQDVGALMEHASGLLLPSLIEGLPGVILEAMASRIPVVSYDVGGIPEVVFHQRTGMLIRKGREDDFVQAMRILETDTSLKLSLTDNAYHICVRDYAMGPIAERFLKQYSKIVSA
jgi:L-malate glycosyltransferase